MKNIVLYFYSLSKSGGAERRICQLANELDKKEYRVYLCSLDATEASSYYPISERVTWWRLGRKQNSLHDKISRIFRLYLALRRHHITIFIGFVMSGDKTIYIATKLAGVRLIVAERNSPQMYWVRLGALQRWLLFMSMHLADRITIQMPEFISKYPQSLHNRIITIPNPVPQASQSSTPSKPNQQGRFIMLAVSRLDKLQKRIMLLMQAYKLLSNEFPQWDLQIVGDGEEMDLLQKFVIEQKLDQRIIFITAKKDIYKYYTGANLFVIPSLWEGFPNALAEAMSHGLPAVGFAEASGVSELIGQGGWLANGNSSVDSLVECLRQAMTNHAERDVRGEIGRNYIKSFTPEKHINKWDNLIKSIMT